MDSFIPALTLGIETGSLTGLFSISWMYRNGFDNVYYSCRDVKKVDTIATSLEMHLVPDYFEYSREILKRGFTERILIDEDTKILFDKNTKRKMLKDEEPTLKEYGPVVKQRLEKYIEFGKAFSGQIEVRCTSVPYITYRQTILYNDEGPFWACDFRKLLSLDPKELPYYLGTIYRS